MKKNKGFTLVELLAVIAILAVLVIIALPNVMDMFNNAKKNSFLTEIKELYTTAEQTWINDSMTETKEREYTRCSSCSLKSLDLTGRIELNYYIKINASGNVIDFYATDGTFQFTHECDILLLEDIKDASQVSTLESDKIITIENDNVKNRNTSSCMNMGDIPDGANYYNLSTENYYSSLQDAFTYVNNNEQIMVLKDVTENTHITLETDKTGIKLDLNGKTITMNTAHITNKGELDIYNSSSHEGKIEGGNFYLISNQAKMYLNNTTSTNKVVINDTSEKSKNGYGAVANGSSGVLTINENVIVKTEINDSIGIVNSGILNMTAGEVSATKYGISVGLYGTLTLGKDDGNVSTSSPLIQTLSTNNEPAIKNNGKFNFYDGILKSSSGTNYAINGNVTKKPNGYTVYKSTSNGIETAYLIQE